VSYALLLTRTATIHHRSADGTPDGYNMPSIQETTTTANVYLEQASRTEDANGRDTAVSTLRCFFDAGVALTHEDIVVIDDVQYLVMGTPDVAFSARTGTAHHIEATLTEVE
jgi:hypothetical protein